MKIKVFTAFSGYDSQCLALDRTLLIPGQPENQTSNPSQLTLFNTL